MRLVVAVVLRFLGELFVERGSPRSVFHFRCTLRCFVAPFVERPPRDRPQFLVLEHSQFASLFGRTMSPQRGLVGPSSLLGKLGGLPEDGATETSCSVSSSAPWPP